MPRPDAHDSPYAADLALAGLLADAADQITMDRYGRADLFVTEKLDHTPVSEADQATEEALRTQLRRARPQDAIYGEEYGGDELAHDATAPRRWILDPIDGTKNYVRGVPVWATLIGLAVRDPQTGTDEVVVGVVSAPALGRRWWAAKGGGAWVSVGGGEPRLLAVSDVADLAEASISYASLGGWGERREQFLGLLERAARTRAYGDFWSYMLVAEGAVDLAAEPELELYDMAALVPIVTEAGGRFTSVEGEAGPWGAGAVASNGRLHDAALRVLASEVA